MKFFALFLVGIRRILNCAKVQVASAGMVGAWFGIRYAAQGLPPTQRSALWIAFLGACAVELREVINAWTEEDVAKINAGGASSPAGGAAPAAAPPAPSPPVPARSPAMPSRTRLPLLLIGMLSMVALFAGGCQALATQPELVTYREGLHAVDEPLYQAHLLLMGDAVKAGIRSPAEQQIVAAGVQAGRDLYTQSVATQAASVAAPAAAAKN